MLLRIMLCVILSMGLVNCKEGDLHLKIQFDRIYGLTAADPLYFGDDTIGQVTRVTYAKESRYLVEVAIEESFAPAATKHARFFVTGDPDRIGRMAIEMVVEKRGGDRLKEGALIVGSTRPSRFAELWEDLGGGFEALKKEFETLSEGLSDQQQAEAFKRFENEMKRLLEEAKKAGKGAREKLFKEMLPKLKKEMEELREWLEKFPREEDRKSPEEKAPTVKQI
jgi:ABC-type transporter Mla subunit MlaD